MMNMRNPRNPKVNFQVKPAAEIPASFFNDVVGEQ